MNNIFTQPNNCEQGRHYVKHPSTILNGIRKIEYWSETDKDFAVIIEDIKDLVRAELGIKVESPKAKFWVRKAVTVNIYTCICKELIYTNKEKGYCTNCGANLKFKL